MKKIVVSLIAFSMFLTLTACYPQVIDSKQYDVNNSQISLHRDELYFIHDGLEISIPDSKLGNASDPKRIGDADDLKFQYTRYTKKNKDGTTFEEGVLNDIDHEPPKKEQRTFEINLINVDIESKLLLIDEIKNDYYFMFDFGDAENYKNVCRFKLGINDVNQIKSDNFNGIAVTLEICKHYAGTESFSITTSDGINDVNTNFKDVKPMYNGSW
jgi:hypothetical protein